MDQPHPPSAHHLTDRLLGDSPETRDLRAHIRHLATFDTLGNPHVPTLLIHGETGTGKGLIARIVHDSGPRAAGPFIAVNCGALPEALLEAELFGFEAGAFTDAKRAKPGLFDAASGGTLFLDEIDALPLSLQSKLLSAVEEKWVRRLGAVADHRVDVKLIVATQVDLQTSVSAGRFRADLYHRLAVVVLAVPPLRAREDDVVLLALPMRLLGHTSPGDILLSPQAARVVEGAFALQARELPLHSGSPDQAMAYAVVGLSPRQLSTGGPTVRARSQCVGRERELAILHDVLATVEGGRGQVVAVVGEPGMGKSRLLGEFRQRLKEPPVMYLDGHQGLCGPGGGAGLGPCAGVVRAGRPLVSALPSAAGLMSVLSHPGSVANGA